MSKLETNTIDTVSGTNTLQVGDGNVATINLGKSGDTVNIPSGATLNIAGTAGTGFPANAPYFHAYNTSSQTINNSTETKKTFTTKIESASGVFDLNNDKFVCVTAGTYLFSINLYGYDSDNNLTRLSTRLNKNGNRVQAFNWNFNSDQDGRDFSVGGAWLQEAAVDDYFEMYAFTTTSDSGSILLYGSSSEYSNYFSGVKLI